jgi:hypothetical protein
MFGLVWVVDGRQCPVAGSSFPRGRLRHEKGSGTGGNEIRYEVTVDDPEVLVEPWMMTPRTLTLNPNPEAGLIAERGNCEVYETKNISSQIRH